MKIKLHSIYASATQRGWPGQIIDVPAGEAEQLIAARYAEAADLSPTTEAAAPLPAESAEAASQTPPADPGGGVPPAAKPAPRRRTK